MKVEVILPAIERWHCLDLLLKNMEKAEKPEGVQVLCVATCGDSYASKLESGLISIFGKDKTRLIRKSGTWIEHDKLRREYYESPLLPEGEDTRLTKLRSVYDTYSKIVELVDRSADLFWFIEDDTLFPLDVFTRYKQYMDVLRADAVTGVSYYWHTLEKHSRNFWSLSVKKSPDGARELKLEPMEPMQSGVVHLGATGLGNVLAKSETVLSWSPESYVDIGSGADISFFYNAMRRGFRAYGVWDIFLPHITKHQNGDIEIRGRVDSTLLPLFGMAHGNN